MVVVTETQPPGYDREKIMRHVAINAQETQEKCAVALDGICARLEAKLETGLAELRNKQHALEQVVDKSAKDLAALSTQHQSQLAHAMLDAAESQANRTWCAPAHPAASRTTLEPLLLPARPGSGGPVGVPSGVGASEAAAGAKSYQGSTISVCASRMMWKRVVSLMNFS